MPLKPTQLRKNLYKLLDQVIETQNPIEINRNGHIVKLVVEQKKNHCKLANIKAHPDAICADPDSFVHIDWSSHWEEGRDL